MDNEINRMIADPQHRQKVIGLIRSNLKDGLSTLSGSQLSYASGRITGRFGASTALSPYAKGAAFLGDYHHGVTRAGAGIASIGEWIALGRSIESIR